MKFSAFIIVFVLLLSIGFAGSGKASSFICILDSLDGAELYSKRDVIFIGKVIGAHKHENADGKVELYTELKIIKSYKGSAKDKVRVYGMYAKDNEEGFIAVNYHGDVLKADPTLCDIEFFYPHITDPERFISDLEMMRFVSDIRFLSKFVPALLAGLFVYFIYRRRKAKTKAAG